MGIRQVEKIVAVDQLDLDLKPTNNLLFLRYQDVPGVVGVVAAEVKPRSVARFGAFT